MTIRLANFFTTLTLLSASHAAAAEQPSPPPNVLWITCEDMSPNLRCFGDEFSISPNLDRLASQGVRYTHAFATEGVCAPARSTIITGVYPPAIGTQHMRCQGTLPEYVKCFPEYLQAAGYYCTNNSKEDYNFRTPKTAWNESSGKAHWRNRQPGQPFFAVFNFIVTHESQVRAAEKQYLKNTARLKPSERHDPAKTPIPPYHPDAPEVRKDWAQYYDNITAMDYLVGDLLAQLEEDGLVEDTVVFFYSDHGAGMPRSKRWLYDSSLRVPLIARFPKKFAHLAPGQPGSTTDRLVSFVDLAPTVLSLARVKVPSHIQGHAFLGSQAAPPRQYVYGFRERMDERYDMLRSVRDQRYLYIRNYNPHLPWFHHQHVSYMYEMPTMKVWQRLADEGKLSGPPAIFMARTKPSEELYDCQSDPHNINNLAGSAEHQDILARLRAAHAKWMADTIDLGLLPEAELRSRFAGKAAHEVVRQQKGGGLSQFSRSENGTVPFGTDIYPLSHLLAAAQLATRMQPDNLPKLVDLMLGDKDPAARYWGALGLLALGQQARPAADALSKALKDPSPSVRIVAAEALCKLDQFEAGLPVLIDALKDKNDWARVAAANVLDRLGEKARPALPQILQAQNDPNEYVVRVTTHTLATLQPKDQNTPARPKQPPGKKKAKKPSSDKAKRKA